MGSIRRSIRNIFVWSYERGTIQYDIICALILAFIFFVPRSCFVSKGSASSRNPSIQKIHIVHPATQSNQERK
jgi:hypothetical protein